jgi:heat shock protein HslJ
MMTIGKQVAYFGLGILILALAACSSPTESIPNTGDGQTPGPVSPIVTPEPPDAGDPLANTQWRLVSFGEPGAEMPVIEGSAVTLEFGADGRVGGSGGCNSYGGVYQVQGDSLSFGEIVSTLMACADERVTQQEGQYLQALQSAGQFELADDRLAIRYGDGSGVLNFVPASSPSPAPTGVTPAISPVATPTAAPAPTEE